MNDEREEIAKVLQQTKSFRSSSNVINAELKSLKKTDYGMCSRLRSIFADSRFVERVCMTYFSKFEVFGNLRNGAWYVSNAAVKSSKDSLARNYAYFKSGDGHSRRVEFSNKRLNLSVLRSACDSAQASLESEDLGSIGLPSHYKGGAVIVDSTRRGKQFPDSFTRTIPLWCMVLNYIKFNKLDDACLFPPWVSSHEATVLKAAISDFAKKIPEEAVLEIRSAMHYPLRPVWISPEEPEDCITEDYANSSRIPCISFTKEDEFTTTEETARSPCMAIVLVSASVLEQKEFDRIFRSWKYIQGAADDEENWSQGLTSELLWKHQEEFEACESDLEAEQMVSQVLGKQKNKIDTSFQGCQAIDIFHGSITTCLTNSSTSKSRIYVQSSASGRYVCEMTRNQVSVFFPVKHCRNDWQNALQNCVKFYDDHAQHVEIVSETAFDKEVHEKALALAVAIILHWKIKIADIDLDRLGKSDVASAHFIVSGAVENAFQGVVVPRRLLKEINVFFFELKKVSITQT